MRLDIPAGTAVRFEPGDEQEVTLVPLAGSRQVYGNGRLMVSYSGWKIRVVIMSYRMDRRAYAETLDRQ